MVQLNGCTVGNDPVRRHGGLCRRIQDEGTRKSVRSHCHGLGISTCRSQGAVNIHRLPGGNLEQGVGVQNNAALPYPGRSSQGKIPADLKQRIAIAAVPQIYGTVRCRGNAEVIRSVRHGNPSQGKRAEGNVQRLVRTRQAGGIQTHGIGRRSGPYG